MKLEEFYTTVGNNNDPLLNIVKNLNEEKAHLIELRRVAQGYLIPVLGKDGRATAKIDPDLMDNAVEAARAIDSSKARIAEIQSQIQKIDAICSRHGIEKPLIKELIRDKASAEAALARKKAAAAAMLGRILQNECSDLEEAQNHPKYLDAVHDYDARRQKDEPRIAKWQTVIDELKAVL